MYVDMGGDGFYSECVVPYLEPAFQNHSELKKIYTRGLCPIAEDFHANRFIGIGLCMCEFSQKEVNQVILAFKRVW